ncbi:rh187 [macacine betaherpesvirus 3]|uniref:Rh187 n=1 Tax=Rhesus cytomegalovirus (strain 68-1) TaxID=47929 RepID=Q2FAB0_RHCM6|nr:rh187 [macacine betaherpesvirus 3]
MKLGGNILTGHISRLKAPFISHVQPLKSKSNNHPLFNMRLLVVFLLAYFWIQDKAIADESDIEDANATCTITGGILDVTWCMMGKALPNETTVFPYYESRENSQRKRCLPMPNTTFSSNDTICLTTRTPAPADLGRILLKECRECTCAIPCYPETIASWDFLFNGDFQRLVYEGRYATIAWLWCMDIMLGTAILLVVVAMGCAIGECYWKCFTEPRIPYRPLSSKED